MNHPTLPDALTTAFLTAGCAIALATSAPLHAAAYDAVLDFSLSGNPNAVWSYGSLSSLTGGTFTLFADAQEDRDYTGEQFWINDANASYPNRDAVVKNASGSSVQYGTVVSQPDQLNLDGQSSIADVRWTAPSDGTYDLEGLFQRNDVNAFPVTVAIIENGATTLFSVSHFNGNGNLEPFSFANLSLPAGTTLDFLEAGNQSYNDTTGLQATITSAPEPSTALTLASGIGMLLTLRRRRS